MQHIDHHPPESSSSDSKPEELLEESWFFGNPLDRPTKKAILRCYSEPCPSSGYGQEMLAMDSSGDNNSLSMKTGEEKAKSTKSIPMGSREHNLLRAPSLPPDIGREDDVESDFALSKLIRQASLNSPDVLPPRRNSRAMKQTSTVSRHRPRKNPELESRIDMEACNDMKRLSLDQNKILRKSTSDLAYKEVRRYKDMGFNSGKRDSSSSEDKSSAPPIPSWVDSKSSSAEDMKAQIKYWARAVAANVK